MLEMFLPGSMGEMTFYALLGTSFAASFITVAFGIGGGAVLHRVDDDIGPGSSQPQCRCPANIAGGAGDQRGLAGERFGVHRCVLSALPAVNRARGSGGKGFVVWIRRLASGWNFPETGNRLSCAS